MEKITFRITSFGSGDSVATFNRTPRGLKKAEAKFEALTKGKGMWATTLVGDGESRHVTTFEPVDLVFHKQIIGG